MAAHHGGSSMERVLNATAGSHAEQRIGTANGFVALAVGIALVVAGSWMAWRATGRFGVDWTLLVTAVAVLIAGGLTLKGLYTLQPNEGAILQLFGAYRGTSRVPGLRATNPFYTRRKLSLRARNLNGERLKVNDKRGNPI